MGEREFSRSEFAHAGQHELPGREGAPHPRRHASRYSIEKVPLLGPLCSPPVSLPSVTLRGNWQPRLWGEHRVERGQLLMVSESPAPQAYPGLITDLEQVTKFLGLICQVGM